MLGTAIVCIWGAGDQLVQQFDGGEHFRIGSDRPLCPPSQLYNRYRVSFVGLKRTRRGVEHISRLTPRLKKDYRLPFWAIMA
jgi:hypothetical protein